MSFKKAKYLFLSSFILLFIFSSCKTIPGENSQLKNDNNPHEFTQAAFSNSKNSEAYVPENPQDDPEYSPILMNMERDVSLYKDYLMYFLGTAVLMTPEMTAAYIKRVEKVQGVTAKIDTNIVPLEKNTVSVVISMYTTYSKFSDLEDGKVWNTALLYNGNWIHPSSVVYYRNKSSLVPYFPVGSVWSRMYVLQFPISKSGIQAENKDIEFSMQSGIATANYFWR